jgi:Ca2+-binding RTX toxin-like protein
MSFTRKYTTCKSATVALALGIMACSSSTGNAPTTPSDPLRATEDSLTPLAAQCTFVSATGLMTVTMADGETALISERAADSNILVNGVGCNVAATHTLLKKIQVTGSLGQNTVILDYSVNGIYAAGTSSGSSSGVALDLKGSTGTADTFALKMTTGVDNVVFGAGAILVNGDTNKDITVTGTVANPGMAAIGTYLVSLGDGNDTFTASGNSTAGAAFARALTVYGGDGNDVFSEGAAVSAGETIHGGAGADTVDYSTRPSTITGGGHVSVSLGAGANDGDIAGNEHDDVREDVETVNGGAGNDTLTAAPFVPANPGATPPTLEIDYAVTFNGNGGNDTLVGDNGADTLNGGAGNDTLRGGLGIDTENGNDGDDTFDEGAVTNGGDAFAGGLGTDTVDYHARVAAVTVTMDGLAANDGEGAEADAVAADIENCTGSATDVNTITGNASDNVLVGGAVIDTINGGNGNDVITGGMGNDILDGGAGDDRFPSGTADDGDDAVTCGAGVDTMDYSARLLSVTATAGGAGGDTVSSEADTLTTCENIWGGAGADVLTGDANPNELVGGGGNDTISGMAGDDVLQGGAPGNTENNTMDCGAGDGDIGFAEGTMGTSVNCEL